MPWRAGQGWEKFWPTPLGGGTWLGKFFHSRAEVGSDFFKLVTLTLGEFFFSIILNI